MFNPALACTHVSRTHTHTPGDAMIDSPMLASR
jgi:hypothetical protein